jgi:hypothetical protein
VNGNAIVAHALEEARVDLGTPRNASHVEAVCARADERVLRRSDGPRRATDRTPAVRVPAALPRDVRAVRKVAEPRSPQESDALEDDGLAARDVEGEGAPRDPAAEKVPDLDLTRVEGKGGWQVRGRVG